MSACYDDTDNDFNEHPVTEKIPYNEEPTISVESSVDVRDFSEFPYKVRQLVDALKNVDKLNFVPINIHVHFPTDLRAEYISPIARLRQAIGENGHSQYMPKYTEGQFK